jgi:hypothetical protein
MKTELSCISCRRPKANLVCGNCEDPVCKDCAEFLEASTFSFRESVPEELTYNYYCSHCYDDVVKPELQAYQDTLTLAKDVFFFFSTQRKPFHLLKRAKHLIHVKECRDRDETILRLGFKAAELGFNAIVEAQVTSKKLRDEGREKSQWEGKGTPAQVDSEKLNRSSYGED